MFRLSYKTSTKWHTFAVAVVPILATVVTSCSDSTEPMRPLASAYVLSTIDANPLPFVYETTSLDKRYVTRTLERIANDTVQVTEIRDVINPTDDDVISFQCTRHNAELSRSGRYIILKSLVLGTSPIVPPIGGPPPIVLVPKYDTLMIQGNALVQVTEAISGQVNQLVFEPGTPTASCGPI